MVEENYNSKQEVELKPEDLARSWLGHRGATVLKGIARAESLLLFENNYEGKAPPARPSWVEPGGMDASDWETAELEYEQEPGEREDTISRLNDKIIDLTDKLRTIEGQMELVQDGNEDLIETYSRLEKRRRAKLKEQERQRQEREKGVEFEGVTDVKTQLDIFTSAVREGKVKVGTSTPNGWKIKEHYPEEELKYSNTGEVYGKNPEQFQVTFVPDKEKPGKRVFMRIYADSEGYPLEIEDFRNSEEGPSMYGKDRKATIGSSLSVRIENQQVINLIACKVKEETMWGYPETHKSGPKEKFEQRHFGKVGNLIYSLTDGVNSIASNNQ